MPSLKNKDLFNNKPGRIVTRHFPDPTPELISPGSDRDPDGGTTGYNQKNHGRNIYNSRSPALCQITPGEYFEPSPHFIKFSSGNQWIMVRIQAGIVFFMLLLLSLKGAGQHSLEISNRLAEYSFRHPQEKIYLHTDKPYYAAGEDVWFKVYLMTGPYHIPDTLSSVVYVELVDSLETIQDRKTIRAREGLGWGDFDLPASLPSGRYVLRAYTQYMRNFDPAFFFRKNILILPVSGQPVSGLNQVAGNPGRQAGMDTLRPVGIKFFPEGGDMVEGLQNYIAFKATNRTGRGTAVEGVVVNTRGDTATSFKSIRFGLGLFTITPEPGEEYTALLNNPVEGLEYPLPEVVARGYTMHINKTGENIFLWVRNNTGARMNNSFVIGQFRGFPFITFQAKPQDDFLYSAFSAREIPSGIIHFTFFDSLGIPQCERLVYNHNEKEQINFGFESDKDNYRRREKTGFQINCTDLNNNPILTNISLSITNTAIVQPDPGEGHLMSYFNLESDLNGTIEEPGYYFNPAHADRFELIDMLMLTHGWRRFTWKKILEGGPRPISHSTEFGFTIGGKLVDFYNRNKSKPGRVRLFIFENQLYYNELETDAEGTFQFRGVNIYDSSKVVMNAWREIGKEDEKKKNKTPKKDNNYALRIDPHTYAGLTPERWPDFYQTPVTLDEYLAKNDYILTIDSSYDELTIILDEVTIEDEKIKEDPFYRAQKLYKRPSARIVLDSLTDTEQSVLLFDLIRRYVPGVNISGTPPDISIRIRGASSITGNNEALILLDGMEVEADFVYYFPASEIAFIDVLKTGSPAVVQDRAGSGVIALYSREKPSVTDEGRKGIASFVFPGYYRAREFYTPDYEVPEEKHIKPDYRSTLYWNPSLTTDETGAMSFSFYTSDEQAEYRIRIEGMTYNGIPVVKDHYFKVK